MSESERAGGRCKARSWCRQLWSIRLTLVFLLTPLVLSPLPTVLMPSDVSIFGVSIADWLLQVELITSPPRYIPIHRGRRLFSIDFFLCLFINLCVSLFLCFFVSKITRKRLDRFAWNFREGVEWPWDDLITFWSIPRNRAMPRCATRVWGLLCFSTTACFWLGMKGLQYIPLTVWRKYCCCSLRPKHNSVAEEFCITSYLCFFVKACIWDFIEIASKVIFTRSLYADINYFTKRISDNEALEVCRGFHNQLFTLLHICCLTGQQRIENGLKHFWTTL